MKEEFEKLLRLRFDDRNRRMVERFTEEKQRRWPISSETVKAVHRVLETELRESVGVVVETAVDVVKRKDSLLAKQKLQEFCDAALSARKEEIESLYLSNVRHIDQGLQNKVMIQPYMSLGEFFDLQRNEMLISLSTVYEKCMEDRGGNLFNVIRNRFLNHPVIAGASIIIAVIVAVAVFAGAVGSLKGMFG